MSALTQYHQTFTPAQLDIIKKTCAPETNHDEFNLFIEAAKGYGLNPMKRQIMATVYSKDDPSKRRMSLIVEIGGLRAIAARSGRYRPADEPARFETDDTLKSPANPHGIVRAIVTAFKQDDRGQWHPVVGEAWWDEHAPITRDGKDGFEWIETGEKWPDSGKPKMKKVPKGEIVLQVDPTSTWAKMPRLMIAKCAEAQALRKGWPEDIGGLYEQAEAAHPLDADMLPSQALEAHQIEKRQALIGKRAGEYAIQFGMGDPIEMIPPGQMHDRIEAYVLSLETIMEVKDFRARNQLALRRYWADDADAALSLNKAMEKREAEISAAPAEVS